ncbi:MAG: glycosyltransferase family 2 protein, partial [Christensenellales bacterium]
MIKQKKTEDWTTDQVDQELDAPAIDRAQMPEVTISLTSFPARIPYVAEALEPILSQTELANRVLLYLAEEQFPQREAELPPALLALCERGLGIRWCDDLRPHKKYFYAMQEYPEDIVITIDDDAVYPEDLVETLLRAYLANPRAISAMRIHKIMFHPDGTIAPYLEWIKEYPARLHEPHMDYIATGVGGVLYPPHSLDPAVFDAGAVREYCLNADDLWLKIAAVCAGTPVALAAEQTPTEFVGDSQKTGLYLSNVTGGENDRQFARALDGFAHLKGADAREEIMDRIARESFSHVRAEHPKVSVVLPVYNVARYLPECVESARAQTLTDIEIICVNDGSTDRSLEILQNYAAIDPRIVIIDKENSGYGHSMNVGMRAARGEYVAILETDDFIRADMYDTLYTIAAENDLDIIKADYHNFWGDGVDRVTRYIAIAGRDRSYYNRVVNPFEDATPFFFTMNTWSGIYKRAFLEAH